MPIFSEKRRKKRIELNHEVAKLVFHVTSLLPLNIAIIHHQIILKVKSLKTTLQILAKLITVKIINAHK
jgi:hypothetical protein